MKIRILLAAGMFCALAACKKEEIKPTILKDEAPAPTANAVEAAKNNAAGMLLPQNNAAPAPMVTAGQPTAPGMNPPHGQPGHRCEIPVGAPLNSTPGQPTPSPAPAQAVVQPTQPAQKDPAAYDIPQNTATAPGMNPPHGQPGHRCDIPVGAPLS